jgi:acetyltransferase-like isoleucine patch superfamily enzyme
MIQRLLRWIEFKRKGIKVWGNCNIYPSARIGKNVSIGAFSEIGPNVVIEDNVRIGAYCFIPEGVHILKDAWIGPRVTFSNDAYPPADKKEWKKTYVLQGASLGAAVSIIPGVVIGAHALIGMGAVVTESVPANEIWVGVPARHKRKYEAEVLSWP